MWGERCRGGGCGESCTDLSLSAQLVWLLRELVKSGVLGADGVCMTFMKQIAGELCQGNEVTAACMSLLVPVGCTPSALYQG